MEVDKRALCAFDDKRFLLADGIHSLAYGHKDITAGSPVDITPARPSGDGASRFLPGEDHVYTIAEARERKLIAPARPGRRFFPVGADPAAIIANVQVAHAGKYYN